MIGFGNIFKAELYKIAKGKSLFKILLAIAIIFILSTIIFNFLYNAIGALTISTLPEDEISKDVVDSVKSEYDAAVAAHEELSAPRKMVDTSVYSTKGIYTLYNYMYQNNLTFASVRVFGASSSLTMNSFVLFIMQVMHIAIAVFATVSIIRSFAGERTNGTLKMQLLRPISKDAIIVGKMLAVWVVSIGLFILSFLLAAVVGVCAYKVDPKTVLLVINGSTIVKTSIAGELFAYLVYYIAAITQYIALGMFLSNIFKKNEGASIALAMVMMFIGETIESVFGYIFIGYIGININMEWINALTLTGPALGYMNLYTMIAISLAWFVTMIGTSIITFRRTDIHT